MLRTSVRNPVTYRKLDMILVIADWKLEEYIMKGDFAALLIPGVNVSGLVVVIAEIAL